jgi:hypothetical protein
MCDQTISVPVRSKRGQMIPSLGETGMSVRRQARLPSAVASQMSL